jgi:predicted AlkP superfamily pyrophosphatase or phosphodiesterase
MRFAWIPIALLLVACPSSGPLSRPEGRLAEARGERDPVVVAIVVDQLAAWVAAERWPHLPDGGFSRLRREGTWVKDLTYLHAVTETAPGHASLFTGRPPHETGIVANTAWRKDLQHKASLLEDPGQELVGPDSRRTRPGVSLALLKVKTLADALKERDPHAVVVALSLKDRGAVFGGGRKPNASLWYDERSGTMVTSTAFSEGLPLWISPFARPVPETLGLDWAPMDPAFLEAHASTGDDQAGETPAIGGRTFPHRLAPGPAVLSAFRSTPRADELLAEAALAAVDGARRKGHPMLLALSFSANDYVGHSFGPDSWEAWDELIRLDATLGRLLDGLDARLGPDGYAVVLSGDHGVAPLPEVVAERHPWCAAGGNPYEKPCAPGVRIHGAEVKKALEEEIQRQLKIGVPVIREVVEALVYLTPEAAALPAGQRQQIGRVLQQKAASLPGIAQALPTAPASEACPPPADESVPALVCRATTTDFGDYYLVPKPGSFFWGGGEPEGASHGSPYRYDRTVPLLVRYPHGARGQVIDRAPFGSYYASAWYALTGEAVEGPYGGVVGRGP